MRKITGAAMILMILLPFTSCRQKPGNTKATGNTGINIGDVAPAINQPDPEGRMIDLSSLRGKMVLIDFWAGWCPPCRAENPNLVQTYLKYKDSTFTTGDGFTIYSVSLDRTRESWVQAIKEDRLEWETHVSDLKYWHSAPAATYQVTGIPANYLIDRNGVILARNLRGEDLGQTLRKYLE